MDSLKAHFGLLNYNHLIPLTSDQAYVQRYTNAIFFVYAPLGTLTCVAVGYIASRFTGANTKALDGLTYYTLGEPIDHPTPKPRAG